jgi:hypothetical protein
MDISQQYIKMCEKAEEVQQGHKFKIGDYLKYHSGYCIEALNVYHGDGIEVNVLGNYKADVKDRCPKNHQQYVWLPRQDQLQELYNEYYKKKKLIWVYQLMHLWNYTEGWEYSKKKKDWFHNEKEMDYWATFQSWEQLWLAMYMRSRHQKVWDGETWQQADTLKEKSST